MSTPQFLLPFFLLAATVLFTMTALPKTSFAASYLNPLVKIENAGCRQDNLKSIYFSADFKAHEQIKICLAFQKISAELSSTQWSPNLSHELKEIWQVFSHETVLLEPLSKNTPSNILAMTDPLPAIRNGEKFAVKVYLRTEKVNSKHFLQVMVHELRHLYDFYEAWKDHTTLSSIEVERRGFLVMGKVARESGKRIAGFPKFWNKDWRNLSEQEINAKTAFAIDSFLAGTKEYQYLFNGQSTVYDFSHHSKFAEIKTAKIF